jgi:threonine/homoserine/homoserine lactone efflux protein
MEFGHWLSLFSICLLGAMSPGPSLAVVLTSTLNGGHRSGYATAVAHGIGVGLYGLLTVTGLAVIITRSPAVFLAIQVLGALYLIYLGAKSLRGGGQAKLESLEEKPATNPALSGFLVAFLNPKLAVFMLALFAQFLDPAAQAMEKGIMVATVGITDACWYAIIVAFVSRESMLRKLQRSAAVIDRVFGVILIVLALSVLLRALLNS